MGTGWTARCPAHDDRNNSLSLAKGEKGDVYYCFAGCSFEDIAAAIRNLIGQANEGIFDSPATDPSPPPESAPEPPPAGGAAPRLVATFTYRNAEGAPLYQVLKYDPKDFRRRYPGACGAWRDPLDGEVRPAPTLYRLPELLAAPPERVVWLTEGEKDADNLAALGLVATTSGGATSWKPEFADYLVGRKVSICPDNDPPGRKFVAAVRQSLVGKALSVRTLQFPVGPGGDVSDWLDAGHTKQELFDIAAAAQEYPPRRWKPSELANAKLPPIEGFLNGSLFARQTVGLIAGRRGGGKTNIVLKLMHAISAGRHFGPYSTRPGKVLFLSQEMTDRQISARMNKMFTPSELREMDHGGATIICREDITLDSEKGVERLAGVVESVRPDVFFLDALFDVKGTSPENDNDMMGLMARQVISTVCIPLNCAGIFTHHTGRPKEDGRTNARGASALEDATSDIMFLEQPKGKTYYTGTFAYPGKVRHAAIPPPFAYTISESEEGRLEVDILADADLISDHDTLVIKARQLCERKGALHLEEIADGLGIPKSMAREVLKSACALGLLERAGTGPATSWSASVSVVM